MIPNALHTIYIDKFKNKIVFYKIKKSLKMYCCCKLRRLEM